MSHEEEDTCHMLDRCVSLCVRVFIRIHAYMCTGHIYVHCVPMYMSRYVSSSACDMYPSPHVTCILLLM